MSLQGNESSTRRRGWHRVVGGQTSFLGLFVLRMRMSQRAGSCQRDYACYQARRMYGSRKVNGPRVKFAQNTWNDRFKGVGFVSGSSAFERDRDEAESPVAPPSPSPPSPAPPSPQAAAEFEDNLVTQMKEDEFTRHAREQTKAQLESITGRMFQVCHSLKVTLLVL